MLSYAGKLHDVFVDRYRSMYIKCNWQLPPRAAFNWKQQLACLEMPRLAPNIALGISVGKSTP
eukprot:scaffold81266_cov15-Prasinocladus_malaysianus.AAC.2